MGTENSELVMRATQWHQPNPKHSTNKKPIPIKWEIVRVPKQKE